MVPLFLFSTLGPWILGSHWALQQCDAQGCQPVPDAPLTQVYRVQTLPTEAQCLHMRGYMQARTDAALAALHQTWRDQSPVAYVQTHTRFVCLPEDDLRGTSNTERQ
jgi:hypothetical protein